ncbi:nitrate reductase delta subunit [Nocardioides sp. BE266]|uniref:nitrate reductase molybdenum cofactor assembly chaperone n=1 Tax=Nocardioides sp. BE266 TaxID=2817725 RepID=UPI002865DE3A|nr:nitrate reductase molybdenum cofactor assembly chaperone [Nocardioides sp. BE266]MDR7254488.1 nitrate reductase delta subunit [Nocardioides sp. BE266]
MRFRRRSSADRHEDAARTWAVCSVLLDYPTEELVSSLDQLEALVPDDAYLAPLFAHLRDTDLRVLQQDYVATFDHTRKCALYLTYFAYGDTRRRGAALVAFKDAYRSGGVEWSEVHGELPDHLCAVLQFGATVDAAIARQLLEDHRAGVEMLRIALAGWRNDDGSVGSPWAGALTAVSGTLRELAGDEAEAVRRLVEQGPPAEEVGLSGYGADPALSTGPTLISSATIPVGAPR